MKNIFKKTNNEVVEEIQETKEEVVMKPKFGLKKKLMIGGGVVALVIGGAVALYNKCKTPESTLIETETDDEEDDCIEVDDYETTDEVRND